MCSSSSLFLPFALLVAFTCVEAILRPGYGSGHRYYGGKGNDNCKTKPPKTPSPSSTTTAVPSTTTTAVPSTTTTAVPSTTTTAVPSTTTTAVPSTTTVAKCPLGFTKYARTPAADNANTAEWCLKAVLQKDPIMIINASALCAAQGPGVVLSSLASDEERTDVGLALKAALTEYGISSGAIAVDGRRKAACVSRDPAVVQSAECTGLNGFEMVDTHTSPTYTFSHWADREPSGTSWIYDMEECVQYSYDEADPTRHNLFNDFYCAALKSPSDPENTIYWNYGALCGVAPI